MKFFNEWFPAESPYGTEHINTRAWGAIGDGNPNLLGDDLGFASVDDAKNGIGGNGKAYPRAGSLSDSADWCAIQGAVDYALAHNIQRVLLFAGRYRPSDTIHLGYGMINGVAQANTVVLEGIAPRATGVSFGWVEIIPINTDRPIINIQGGRLTGVRNLTLTGPTSITPPSGFVAFVDPASWIPSGAKTYTKAPYCGICIDGYLSGANYEHENSPPPEQPYPVPKYPPWDAASPANVFSSAANQVTYANNAYNKAPSSKTIIENVGFSNCLIGVMQSPLYGVQGDYTVIKNCGFGYLQVAVAIGNSQARSMDMSNLTSDSVHTIIDTSTYGSGNGNAQGNFSNFSLINTYRIIHGAGEWSHPLFFSSLYVENGVIIGDFPDCPVTFESCSFSAADMGVENKPITITGLAWAGGTATATCASLAAIGDVGWTDGTRWLSVSGNPAGWNFTGSGTWVDDTHFTYPLAVNPGSFTSATGTTQVITQWHEVPFFVGHATFRRCRFESRFLTSFPQKCTFEECNFGYPLVQDPNAVLSPGMRKAVAAFGRVLNSFDTLSMGRSAFLGLNKMIGRTSQPYIQFFDGYNDGYYVSNMWGVGQKAPGSIVNYDIPLEARIGMVNTSGGTPSGITLTGITFPDMPGRQEIGDVILMATSNNYTWYSVEAIGAGPTYPVTLRRLNNFTALNGVYTPTTAVEGNSYYLPIGILDLVPYNNLAGGLFMKTAETSPVITFVDGADVAVNVSTLGLTLKSKPLWINAEEKLYAGQLPFPRHTYIDSLATSANSITMNKSALLTGWWLYGPGIKRIK